MREKEVKGGKRGPFMAFYGLLRPTKQTLIQDLLIKTYSLHFTRVCLSVLQKFALSKFGNFFLAIEVGPFISTNNILITFSFYFTYLTYCILKPYPTKNAYYCEMEGVPYIIATLVYLE